MKDKKLIGLIASSAISFSLIARQSFAQQMLLEEDQDDETYFRMLEV